MSSVMVQWLISTEPEDYPAAVATMEARAAAIRAGAGEELVWLLEHPPLYSAGTSADLADLKQPGRFPLHRTGRGGQLTYHGPGQRVAYVLLDLQRRDGDLRRHVWRLEEWAIRALADFGLAAGRRAGRIGLWVAGAAGRENKIAAIGVRVRHWVTYHGLAINLEPDLEHFQGIVPCGIADPALGVTSLAAEGIGATLADLDSALQRHFDAVFGRPAALGAPAPAA